MKYTVLIDNFEGPLDLLLHLIKQDNINIEDIQIEVIVNEYLNYIQTMKEINLDIASEYLVMAAELIEMKSRYLLPTKEKEEDDYIEDPREELINRLLEYKKYKEVKEEFKLLEEERKKYFTKMPEDLTMYDSEPINLEGLSINDLQEAFLKFLKKKKQEEPIPTKITKKEYSLHKRREEIKKILDVKKRVSFDELFEDYRRDYIIITFLAILDIASKEKVELTQDNNFEKIYLEKR